MLRNIMKKMISNSIGKDSSESTLKNLLNLAWSVLDSSMLYPESYL
jgi:hypothetical protein